MILAGIVIGYSGAKDLKSGKFITYCKFKSVMRISRRARDMLGSSIGTTALPSSLRVGLRDSEGGLESKVVAENLGNDVIDSDSDEDEEAQGSSNLRIGKRRSSEGGVLSCISSVATRIYNGLRVVYRIYSAPEVRSIVLFNSTMVIGSFYIAMSVTNWNGISRVEDEESENETSDSDRFSLTTTWILIVSQWSFVVLYFFTLEVFSSGNRGSSISDVSADSPADAPENVEMNAMMIGDEDL